MTSLTAFLLLSAFMLIAAVLGLWGMGKILRKERYSRTG
jgi:hypothetical protein